MKYRILYNKNYNTILETNRKKIKIKLIIITI